MFFQILSFLFSLLTLILTGVMLFTFRKPRRITAASSLSSALISLLLPAIFLIITGARPDLRLMLPFFSLGLLLGYIRGAMMKLEFVGDQVVGRHSRIFLLLWGFSLALNQALSSLDSSILMAFGLASLFLTTGTQVGFYGILAVRRLAMILPEVDTGRIQNKNFQKMIVVGFGGLLLLFFIETLLLSIPALPFLSGASASPLYSGEENIPTEYTADEEYQAEQLPATYDKFFDGEQVLVWTRPPLFSGLSQPICCSIIPVKGSSDCG